MLSLRNLRLAFLPKCIISAKFFLSNFEKFWFRFYGPKKTLFFCFSFFHFDDFVTTFPKDFMKKQTIFVTNIKSTHNFLHFQKDLRSKNFWQWNDGLFLKMKKLRFLTADFDKCRMEKIQNYPNLSKKDRGTLILKDCGIASYPCSNYEPSNLLF